MKLRMALPIELIEIARTEVGGTREGGTLELGEHSVPPPKARPSQMNTPPAPDHDVTRLVSIYV